MKKNVVLWLLPLAVVLLMGFPFDLSALTDKEQTQLQKLEAKARPTKNEQKQLEQLREKARLESLESPTTLNRDLDKFNSQLTSPEVGSGTSVSPLSAGSTSARPESSSGQVPAWVEDLNILKDEFNKDDEYYIGIGSAKDEANPLQAIRSAEALARQDIAFQQTSQVKARIIDTYYSKHEELSEDQIVGSQSINMELFPVTVVKREKVGDFWWVAVTASKKSAEKAITEQNSRVESADGESAIERAVRMMEESLKNW
ncbi:hypothetical protein FACS189485_20970 [Spirochaetia bacterium]|nr:hypothetical protein FACS189485_20970 [Spirochaetia bacterium]